MPDKNVPVTAEAGGKICVVHPCNDWETAQNAEMFLELLPFAKSCGVKIATENMWNWDSRHDKASNAACAYKDDFKKHIELLNSKWFTCCVDIGHAEMMEGSSAKMILETLGDHVGCLHIHDNDRKHDFHKIPFSVVVK